ncbi:MAG TPA: trypsin-like peptidase domain-containing protein [Pyrinomonadaceae bacterium]
MANGLVIHIARGQDRHTEVLSLERVRIGPGEDCHIRLAPDAPTDSTLLLELARTNGNYRVTEFDPASGPTINGVPIEHGDAIEDGDELRFAGAADLAVQFFPVRELPAVVAHRRAQVAPFIEQAAIEAAVTARRDDAKVFLREFTRELLREINLTTKIGVVLVTVILVGGLLYLGNAARRELKRSRDLIDKQNEQLTRMGEALDGTRQKFDDVDKKSQDIIASLSLAPRLRGEYGNGVCLIAGSYQLVEAGTGRPLRYPETQQNEDGSVISNGAEQPVLTPEGNGAPYIADFVGTGFHVGGGYIVTNRHLVVEPWTANDGVQSLSASVSGQFRVTRLVAFFPDHTQPYVLRVRQATARDDLAVGQIDPAQMPADVPALPLDKDSGAAGIGKAVVMMGYPSGEERLLATLPEGESRSIMQRYGSSIETLLAHLAERNYIKPLTTQGHITDVDARRLEFDARNAVGGSGSPVFGQSGGVIGVNFAAFTGMPDANYAVPARFVYPLLERSGWKSPEPDDKDTDANANTSNTKDAKDSRVATTQTNQSR